VKLAVREAESDALRRSLDDTQVSSAIAEIEVLRAVRRRDPNLTRDAEEVVNQISLVEITKTIRARAAALGPAELRSLDAVHVATALEIGDEVSRFVTYDLRLADAARRAGFSVAAPTS